MKPHRVSLGTVCALIVSFAIAYPSRAEVPTMHERTLPNGIRVCYLHVKGSADFSIFTFSPMGLAFDDAGRTQWSHLVEHLVIRTTMQKDLSQGNAETQPDHMRLDFYGNQANWREGLTHHAKWMSGLPFSDESVRIEPGRANSEADHTAKNVFTHKFATAAWNQVSRLGQKHAAVKADLLNADRASLEAYRDARLVVPGQTMICLIGGVEPNDVLTAASEAIGAIKPTGKIAPKVPVPKPGHHNATWDLDARHVMLTWPIPGPAGDGKTHAAMLAFSRIMWVGLSQDAELQKLAGPVFAGADMTCPESGYFYLSAGCRPEADGAQLRRRLAEHVSEAIASIEKGFPVWFDPRQLAIDMEMQDPDVWRAQAPKEMKPGMIEAQLAIVWGSPEFRIGKRKQAVMAAARKLAAADVRTIARKYLPADRVTSVEFTPKRDAGENDGL